MMQIIKPGTKIDFVGKRKLFFSISAILVAVCLGLIFIKGFNYGIDFAGGTAMRVKFQQAVSLEEVRTQLSDVIFGEFSLQNFGEPNEVLIRVGESGNLQTLSSSIKSKLESAFEDNAPVIESTEQVGPQVGDDLRKKAYMALLFSTIGILIYVALRFELVFAISAIIALMQDVILTMGIFALTGKEFNLTVVAAVLTVIGYSLNDTIVVFDRIREKIKAGALEKIDLKTLINLSVNETLSRTVLTSLLTSLAVISLLIFGGAAINSFAVIMLTGIVVGTYSSVAIASSFLYVIRTKKTGTIKQNARI